MSSVYGCTSTVERFATISAVPIASLSFDDGARRSNTYDAMKIIKSNYNCDGHVRVHASLPSQGKFILTEANGQ